MGSEPPINLPTTLPPGWNTPRLLPAKSAIQEKAYAILGELPADKHVAVVAVADFVGVRLAAMARGEAVGGEWTFTGWVGKRWTEPKPEGGVELRWTI